MGKAEAGTPKAIANAIKAKGLQKLRWYCQLCQKQCRDENGYRNHTQSESHVKKALQAGETQGRTIGDFSRQFQADFVRLLRTTHREKPVNANRFYNQYIQDKHHVHMNATKWHSLTEFVKHLGRSGVVRVTEDEQNGVQISWIDNSPEALERQDASRKRERVEKGDELSTHMLIQQKIERAKRLKEQSSSVDKEQDATDNRLDDSATISLNLRENHDKDELKPEDKPLKVNALKPNPLTNPLKATTPLKTNPLKASNPLKANPLKGNPLKPSTESSRVSKPANVYEQLMQKDQVWKSRKR
ncbi:hypothetical protein TRVA0_019S00276 [Trichomonascus vanleenenianus]|uniref:Rts2p n=1 Tax=Trichomonascus vanleenenianus TaxID=2268995 RepID=UPI003ECA4078